MKAVVFNLIFLILTFNVLGQNNPNQYNDEVNRIFQNVNQSHATTGFLLPKALRMIDYENYDGTNLTVANKATYAKLVNIYSMLWMSKTSSNVGLMEPSYFYNFNMGGGNTEPIALIAQSYDDIRSDAFTLNLLKVQNEALYDVPNRNQSPFKKRTLFIAAPKKTSFYTSIVSFVIPADKVISNLGINNLSINWGAGNGFQSYNIGQTVSVSYPRSATYAVTVRWTDANGLSLQTQFDVTIDAGLENLSRSCHAPFYTPNECVRRLQILASDNSTSANVTVFSACPDGRLRKPLFILDGIDFNPFGNSFNANDLALTLRERLIEPQVATSSLSHTLKNEGYDLIFVDWNHGGQRNIRSNSLLFREILDFFFSIGINAKMEVLKKIWWLRLVWEA